MYAAPPPFESEGEWPKVVKRWLKTGKTIRFEDGTSVILTGYGRMQIEEAPDWLLNELYGLTP